MADNEFIPRPETPQAKGSKASEPTTAEGRLARLRGLVIKERQVAEKALEETLAARHERDQYRRVLAASLRGETIVGDRCTGLEQELDKQQALLVESASKLGQLEGQNSELGKRIEQSSAARGGEFATLKQDWRAERERLQAELARASQERGEAQGRLTEIQLRLEQELPNFAHFQRVRAIGLFVCSGLASATAVAFMLPLARVLYGSSSPEEMLLAVGMGPWTLVATECVLLTLAFALLNKGIRNFKGSGG